MLVGRRRHQATPLGDASSRALEDLPARRRAGADEAGDLAVREVEDVMKEEDGALGRRQALEDHEEGHGDALEAVERIVHEHPDARIVMVSSVGYQDNILAALQKGARHFVQKPVKPDALYEIIRYVLNDDGVTAAVGAGERSR